MPRGREKDRLVVEKRIVKCEGSIGKINAG
jgi:hypothetical protein